MSSKKKKAKKELSEAVDSEVLETEAVDTKKKKKKAKKEKTPMDLDSKKTLFKSFTALVCVIAVCITAVVNTGKMCDAAKKTAEQRGSAATEAMGDDAAVDGEVPADDAVVDEVPTDASGEEVPTDAAPADDASAGTAGTDTSSSAGTASTGSNKTTAAASSGIPTGVAQIVSYYNTATAKVAAKKAPFSKTRSTVEKSYEAGLPLKASKGLVNKFMGVGDDNKFTKSVTSADAESYHKYFQASKLTASDVTNATCTKSGNNYTITLNIKNGSSSVKNGKVVSSNNSPLDRSGLACGDKDKDYWDHKTAENVMSAISDVAGSANISESYSNAVITAVVNATTGNLVSLTAKFDFKFELSNIMGSSGKSTASSTVSMTGFKM